MNQVRIQIDQYQGPMGLLLYLIRKEEMNILDIDIVKITGQYLKYIESLNSFDLEGASDFIAMAATLIHIKSKMLLPVEGEDEEDIEDPRKDLVNRLLQFQAYKNASLKLYDRPLLNRDQWSLKTNEKIKPIILDGEIDLEENGLFQLISSYKKSMKQSKKSVHVIGSRLQSIASRVTEISRLFRPKKWIQFFGLIFVGGNVPKSDAELKPRLLITFISLLELAKQGYVNLFQNELYSDIRLEALKEVQGDFVFSTFGEEEAVSVSDVLTDDVKPTNPVNSNPLTEDANQDVKLDFSHIEYSK